MTGKERILAKLRGEPTDSLPLMPITMMFAADLAGVPYRNYAADHRVLAEVQTRVAETFGFDYVSAISDPAREVSDLDAEFVVAAPGQRIAASYDATVVKVQT